MLDEKDVQAVAEKMQEVTTEFEKKHEAVFNGKATEKQVEEAKIEFKNIVSKMEETIKTQGTDITTLKMKLQGFSAESIEKGNVYEMLEKHKMDFLKIKSNKTGVKEFLLGVAKDGNYSLLEIPLNADKEIYSINTALKAAATTGVNTVNPSITSTALTGNTLPQLVANAPISTVRRTYPWVLDFVFVGNTDLPAYPWIDEIPKEGAFAVTAEGEIKPLQQYKFRVNTANYEKVTGRTELTEEFQNDFPNIVTQIKRLMEIDCKNDMNNQILTKLIAAATPYANPTLVGKIDNCDDYGAIAAAIGQLGNFYYTPDILVVNNNKGIEMSLQKATGDGQYLANPLSGNNLIDTIKKTITHPSVSYGDFFIGDGNVFNVIMRGDTIVRMGFAQGNWESNKFSLLVEQYYYAFIKESQKAGLIKGNFDAIKALVEKP